MAMVDDRGHDPRGPKHSGQFGGAAPDSLLVLIRALASSRRNGDVAVDGLDREEWTGESYSDDEFRELAEVLPGLRFMARAGSASGSGPGPAITVTGIDVLAGRQGAQRGRAARAGQGQPARAPGAGCGRGAGRARPPPRGAEAVRHRAEVHAQETGTGFAADDRPARPTRRRARRSRPPGAARPCRSPPAARSRS